MAIPTGSLNIQPDRAVNAQRSQLLTVMADAVSECRTAADQAAELNETGQKTSAGFDSKCWGSSSFILLLFQFLGFGSHNAVKPGILREVVYKRQDRGAIEQQALTLTGVGHIAKLVRGNPQLLRQNLTVSACLVKHIHEVGVFKDVLYLAAAQKVFDILRDTCRNTAPFSESLPDFHRTLPHYDHQTSRIEKGG